MPGIIPNQGVTYRTAAGDCINQPSVSNAYCPGPNFDMTCPLTALPNDCTARLDPAQINALVSELLAFAEALCPDGNWNCGSVSNLADIWNSGCWKESADLDLCSATIVESDPSILFIGCQNGETVRFQFDPCDWSDDIVDCIVSSDAGNLINQGSDGLLLITPLQVVAAICADETAGDGLAGCLISTDPNNALGQGAGDGRLFVAPADTDCCPDTMAYDPVTGELTITTIGGDTITATIPRGVVSNSLSTSVVDTTTEGNLSSSGAIPTPQINLNIPQDFDGQPAQGIIEISLEADQTLIGNGDVTYQIEVSADGGETWMPVATRDVVVTGRAPGTEDNDSLTMTTSIPVSFANLLAPGDLRIRGNGVVNTQFETGSSVDVTANASYVAGPDYNGVVT